MLNPVFNNYTERGEQLLVEDLIIETIQIYGVNVIYLPRESIERDKIFGEDIVSKFARIFQIEAYMETIDGFEGNSYITSQLGLQIDEQTTFTIAKKRFTEVIKNRVKPLEGDLIYFPISNSLFEINRVSNKSPFFQTGKQHIYKLECELYSHSHEDFVTNNKVLDSINYDHGDINNILNADNIEIEQEGSLFISNNSTIDDVINEFDPSNPFGEE
jgi:hypothetical protein